MMAIAPMAAVADDLATSASVRQESVRVALVAADPLVQASLKAAARHVCSRDDDASDLSAFRDYQACRAAAFDEALSRLSQTQIRFSQAKSQGDSKLASAESSASDTSKN